MNYSLSFSRSKVRYFRKWTNKGYGIFASLKVIVKICVISLSYSILVLPVSAVAQTDTLILGSDREIDEVVVSDSKRSTTFPELANAVVVITHEEFRSLPVATLQELLEQFASVDIRQRGGHGVQADLILRGGSFDQVLVLLNGVNITDPQTGHHNLNIPIDLQSIHKIEILQGPGARAYGHGAFSGAVNIITSPHGKTFADIALSVGENGLLKATSSTAFVNREAEFYIAGSTTKSSGFTENTDFAIHNLFAQAQIPVLSGLVDAQAGFQSKGFGAQSFYTPRFPEQYEKTSNYLLSATYLKKVGKTTFTPQVYYRLHNDRFELFRNQAPEWYAGHNYHTTRVYGGLIKFSHLGLHSKLNAGVEYRYEGILSNILGDVLVEPIKASGYDDVFYTKGKEREMKNLFADYTLYLSRLTLSAGVMLAHSNLFGFSLNRGADVGFSVTQKSKVYATYSRSTRFPTFTDLYYTGPTNTGNPNLKPEIADNYEIGVKYSNFLTSLNASTFYRNGKNVIDWVKKVDEEMWSTQNHTNLKTWGVETHISLKPELIKPFIKRITLGYTFLNTKKENNDELLSYYVLDYLKHKASISVNNTFWKNISSSLSLNWQDREGTYTEYPSGLERSYKPFFLVDLRISWEKNSLKLFGDVSNLLNKKYSDLGNVPQAGRWISFGVNYRFVKGKG